MDLKAKIERLKGQRKQKEREYRNAQRAYVTAYRDSVTTEAARAIIQKAAQMTQDQLRYHITELGTMALQAVFEEDIGLDLQFTEHKDKTVAALKFLRGGMLTDPMEADSGGACDIASEALRDSLWYVQRPRTMTLMVRDEPAKNINDSSRDMQRRYAEMVRQVSDRLGLQFLIVTMLPELEDMADKVFKL